MNVDGARTPDLTTASSNNHLLSHLLTCPKNGLYVCLFFTPAAEWDGSSHRKGDNMEHKSCTLWLLLCFTTMCSCKIKWRQPFNIKGWILGRLCLKLWRRHRHSLRTGHGNDTRWNTHSETVNTNTFRNDRYCSTIYFNWVILFHSFIQMFYYCI